MPAGVAGGASACRRTRSPRPARAARARRAPSADVLQRQEPLGLPGEHLVGHALERLAEHHEAAGRPGRARRGGCSTASPARRPLPHSTASTTRSRVCRGLTLTQPAPRRPASYGASRDLTTTPSWPAATTSANSRRASSGSAVTRARHHQLGAAARRRAGRSRSAPGASSRSSPSTCSRSKKYGRERDLRRAAWPTSTPLAVRAPVSWNGRARPSGVERDRLAVEHQRVRRQRGDRLDDLGHPVGDVLQAAGEHPHPAVVLVHLDRGCRRACSRRHRARPPILASASSTSAALDASIGRTGRPTSSPNPRSASTPPASAADGDRRGGAGEHRRPADGGRGHVRGRGDRLEHQPVERALPQLTGDQPAQVGLLVGGGPGEQRRDERGRDGPGTRPRRRRRSRSKASCTSATVRLPVAAGAGRPSGPASPSPVRRWRSDPGRGRHVTVCTSSGPACAQRGGQGGDLGRAGAGGADGGGGGDEVSEQHAAIVSEGPT